MLLYLDHAYDRFRREGRMRNLEDLEEAVEFGAVKRIRPKMMTVMAILMGLLPILSYSYETYSLNDWQQDSGLPWVESVGADTLLRDTSRSYQWGNRLFNLGTYLAPGYDAHIGFVGFSYRF